jgi:osmotically-inducible protein OsmY
MIAASKRGASEPLAGGLTPCRIAEGEAHARLRRSGYLALRDLRCEVASGVLHLRGRVPSYYLKQMAQSIVDEVDGVVQVFNFVEVGEPGTAWLSR